MNVLISVALQVVGKALAPVADGLLEAWGATKNLGPNIEALRMELLLVKATLELASGKKIHGPAMEELLGKLRDSAHCAEDLLDELDYFRIHDELHGTSDAADQHPKGGVHALALNARHTAKAVGKRVICCAWPRAGQRPDNNSSSAPNANQEVSGCMPKLGKLLHCSSSPHVHHGNFGQSTLSGAPQREPAEETPMLKFNRIDVSAKMKQIVEQLQPVRKEVTKILRSCGHNTVSDITQSRPITIGQSIEPKLYGRDLMVKSIIQDITKGDCCGKDLTVLPIVGPGGIGKTTMIQHIYHNKEVRNHFQVLIWVCVSVSFNLNKMLEEISKQIPEVEEEEKCGKTIVDLIEHRLKSKRFLVVLDDIWECSDEDDWRRLLLPLKTSQEKGSMILVTTRFPRIVKMVGTTYHSIELEGLEFKYFRELFHAIVFGDDECRRDHNFLLEIGDQIMAKLKGSPLAAKTVGRLLRKDLNLPHWRRVLESKEWERQSGVNDIMPALKLSYDYLPFDLQQCFSYAALFPADFHFSSSQLINFWIGLDILQPGARNQPFQDIGLRNLNDLVTHGFFREEKTEGLTSYAMHDLLHDLALQVGSHDCISLHRSNMRSVNIQPSIRHLSIIIDDVGADNVVSSENFKCELRKIKKRLKVEHLQTLMLFGDIDESFANILVDLFREASALRVLRLLNMPCPVESMLHNFSALVHLRYLCLGTGRGMHLPLAISRFYHLRILDLGSWWGGYCDLPRDFSNLTKLRHLYTLSDELHSDIYNVGKLKLLEELKIFRVNKESEGFEPKQLEHLAELRELGIFNLENIHTVEEAAKAKLMEKNYLLRLTLDWDRERSNTEADAEQVVLESLQPHRYLQELCIRGHRGSSCPTWLGDKLAVEDLQSLHLDGVSWQCLPSLGKMQGLGKVTLKNIATIKEFVIVKQSFCCLIRLELICLGSFEKWAPSQDAHHMFPVLQVLIIRDCPKLLELPFSNHIAYPIDQDRNVDWFPKLQELEINHCPELLLVAHIPWTETLQHIKISDVKLLQKFEYHPDFCYGVSLKIVGKDDLQSLDQVLAFNKLTGLESLTLEKCPPLEWKHLLMLTSLKRLIADNLDGLVRPSGGEAGVERHHPVVEELSMVQQSLGGPSGKELAELLTHLPSLSKLYICGCINIIQLKMVIGEAVEDGLLLSRTHLSDSLRELYIGDYPSDLSLAELLTHLQRISRLFIYGCENITQLAMASSEVDPSLEKEEGGLLLFPTNLSDSLRELVIINCPELVLVDHYHSAVLPTRGVGGEGGLQALRSLQSLSIYGCPKLLSSKSSFSCFLFPSSLQYLSLFGVEGMGTLEPLSNLTSLTTLKLWRCGEDLRCKGLEPLLTTGGQLRELTVYGSPKFFAGWDPNPRRVQLQDEGGEAQELQQFVSTPSSSKLQQLFTDEAMGLHVVPICSFLSSSLTFLRLSGTYSEEMEQFTKEQEDALPLLASLQQLYFVSFTKLQQLPSGLHKLTNLKRLVVHSCPALRSLPKDGLPKSLQELDVCTYDNEDLKQQCRGLVGTIPKIRLQLREY